MVQRDRPVGVILIAIWFFLNGFIALLTAFVPLVVRDTLAGLGLPGDSMLFLAGLLLLLAAVNFALGWGLLELRNWARVTTIVLAALSLIGAVFGGVSLFGGTRPIIGTAPLVWAIIYGLVIWYLMQPEIQDVFAAPPVWSGGFGEQIPRTLRDDSIGPDYTRKTEEMGGGPVRTAVGGTSPTVGVGTVRGERGASLPRTQLVDQAAPVSAWLVVQRGREQGRQFGLATTGRNSIGRDGAQCDIMLDDSTVSGLHAQIRWENGRFVIYDMGSLNHTKINGRDVQRQTLLDNDLIQVGETTMVFKSVATRRR